MRACVGLAAVTGGTGFLGGYIVSALILAGWHVRILVRNAADRVPLEDPEPEVVRGDLSDHAALKRLVAGADSVIHAAALVKAPEAAAFRRVNIRGTANLLAAVRTYAPATRFILVSSMAAREPSLSTYAATKRAGEDILTIVFGASLNWVIIRPCAIYGPGDAATFVFFRAVNWRILPCPRQCGARITLVHARDAAAAIVALCAPGQLHTAFEITDARREGYSWQEIAGAAVQAVEKRAIVLPVPDAAIRCTAAIAMLSALLGRGSPFLTFGKAREILHSDWSSSPGIQLPAALWQPTITLLDGFKETVRWYRGEHWLR